jgi:hypothetical protein
VRFSAAVSPIGLKEVTVTCCLLRSMLTKVLAAYQLIETAALLNAQLTRRDTTDWALILNAAVQQVHGRISVVYYVSKS